VSRATGLVVVFALLVLVSPEAAPAHSRSTSYSSWTFDGRDARVRVRIPQLELTRLPWGVVSPPLVRPELGAYLTGKLRLEVGGEPCSLVDGPRALAAPRDRAVLEWRLRCKEAGPRVIASDVLLDVAPSHLHFARIKDPDGSFTERVLSNVDARWAIPGVEAGSDEAGARPVGSSFGTYVVMGADHIRTGYDHLAFLLGLLLLATRVREVVTIVTGFTIAHSITLGLAVVGRLVPDPAAVEALIGLSIALVAAENGWVLSGRSPWVPRVVVSVLLAAAVIAVAGVGAVPGAALVGLALFSVCYFGLLGRVDEPFRLRAALAFCFGLIHGFGFAGVLGEMMLPQDRLLPALFGFNVGVELGQLVIVALAWPLLALLKRHGGGLSHGWFVEAATGVVCALGVFWWVARAYA
jgi:hypothetical protein